MTMEETRLKKRSFVGSCCFGVKLKSFEIILELVKGKLVGKIVERG